MVEIFWPIVKAGFQNYPGISPPAIWRKIRFIFSAFRARHLLENFSARMSHLKLVGRVSLTSDVVGMIEWPYINNSWDVSERLDRIATHYEMLASLSNNLLLVSRSNPWTLVHLSTISNACKIVLDRAPWFKREGELVLNLFKDELRVASIAFTFGIRDDAPTIFIGAVQGIHRGIPTDRSLLIYKHLTKDFEGLRPRSLLLDVLKMICNALGVKSILAVADENRHHRHKFFGEYPAEKMGVSYNTIWAENAGVPSDIPGFYEIPVEIARRQQDEIPTRKRAMYKRRYDILDSIRSEVVNMLR